MSLCLLGRYIFMLDFFYFILLVDKVLNMKVFMSKINFLFFLFSNKKIVFQPYSKLEKASEVYRTPLN